MQNSVSAGHKSFCRNTFSEVQFSEDLGLIAL
jgi:hypothetical protein